MKYCATVIAVRDMEKSLQFYKDLFDPDGHLIEVSESMYSVACKQFEAGKTIEETVKLV